MKIFFNGLINDICSACASAKSKDETATNARKNPCHQTIDQLDYLQQNVYEGFPINVKRQPAQMFRRSSEEKRVFQKKQ